MKKLIINADDFGYSRGINWGIIESHQRGILTSTTLMANMPGFDHAVELASQNPKLGIGVHMTLTCLAPILKDHKTIVDENGNFKKISFFKNNMDYDVEEVYREWDAQIQKIYAAGINPTHLDSHHHTHTLPQHREITLRLARKYNLPVRGNMDLPEDIKTVSYFETEFDQLGKNAEETYTDYLNEVLDKVEKYGTVEAMVHPGYLDHLVYTNSTLHEQRVCVADFLQNSEFSKRMKNQTDIMLATYGDL